MRTVRALITTAAVIGAISGCSSSVNIGGPGASGPTCLSPPTEWSPENLNGTLVLAAQSVQTASQVPCVRPLPAGWTFNSFSARRGESDIRLDLGRAYSNALVVTLTRACDVRALPLVSSDHPGLRRYDDVHRSPEHFTGRRYYLFPGGCITFRFDVRGVAAADAAGTVARSVGVVDRADLRKYVGLFSRGRFHLDPT